MGRFVRRGALVALAVALWLAVTACASDGDGAHAILGEWGARTQSGELVRAFVFEAGGTYGVLDPSGTGLPATNGGYIELDVSTVQSLAGTYPGHGRTTFHVEGDALTVTVGDDVFLGFERMEAE